MAKDPPGSHLGEYCQNSDPDCLPICLSDCHDISLILTYCILRDFETTCSTRMHVGLQVFHDLEVSTLARPTGSDPLMQVIAGCS